MKILSIETSCDETGLAVLECKGDITSPSFNILSNQLLSQILAHRKYGGVYPNLAKRLHSENLVPLLKESLKEANFLQVKSQKSKVKSEEIGNILEREPELLEQFERFIPSIDKPKIDAIAVTQGPGLEPALWVGINFAKALSSIWNIPLIPVNHMEGHIASVLYKNDQKVAFPALVLLISGAHTELILARDWGEYELLGQTRDDAVGEAFDKVGRMLGLPYPGGPEISRLAEQSRNFKSTTTKIKLPRPMINSDDYDFSFSGLKTAVLYKIRDKKLTQKDKEEIALEFENAIIDVFLSKTRKALKEYSPKILIVAGGVAANKQLRERFQKLDTKLFIPHQDVTGDNAIMIGIAGYLNILYKKDRADAGIEPDIRAQGTLPLTAA